MNFEHLAEQCLMERFNQMVKIWSGVKYFNKVEDIYDFLKAHPNVGEPNKDGAFSKVYKSLNGEEFVLKVSYKPTDGWVNFADYVSANNLHLENSLFPHIPRKYFKILPEGGIFGTRAAIGFIEHLEINQTLTYAQDDLAWKDAKRDHPDIKEKGHIIYEDFSRYKKGSKVLSPYVAKHFNVNEEQLYHYYDVIIKIFGPNKTLDLHGQNIGYRKNGSTVFFDPVSYLIAGWGSTHHEL